jgi:hypothetical protein
VAAIRDLILKQRSQLERAFGAGQFQVNEVTELCCEIVTNTAQIHLAYDERRMTTDSQVRALQVPEGMSESAPTEWWLRFLDRDDPARCRGPLNVHQVERELALVSDIVLSALTNLRTARDATCFLRGYEHGRLDAD